MQWKWDITPMSNVTYANWNTDYDDSIVEGNMYVVLDSRGRWDVTSADRNSYICETRPLQHSEA